MATGQVTKTATVWQRRPCYLARLRFTKPLLYQLSYVGGKRAKHCIQRRFTQARYKGSTNVSPISRSAMRSGVLLSAASKRSIGSRKGSKLRRNV